MPRPRELLETLRGKRGPFGLLLLTVFFADLGLGIQIASYPNFMVEQLSIRPEQLGILETVRETPGFILVFIAALTMRVAEPVLASGALLLEAIGMSSVYFVASVDTLILISFTWSLGLHTWMPLNQSIALALSDDTNRGMRLGQVRSTTSLANLVGMGLVAVLAAPLGLRSIFLVAGAGIFVAALLVFTIPRNLRRVEKPRLVFKRKYGLYYALTFLEGSRKQVFITFAVFALVKVYGATVSEIALAMVAISIVNLLIAPMVGKAIDRWGERRILTINYVALVFIFISYAVVTYLPALFGIYILDGIVYTLSIAVTTYVDRIAEPRDVMPTLSMGVTANHLAAILIPVTGGLLWATYGYQLFFIAGAVIVAVSLLVARFVPNRQTSEAPQPV